MFLTTVFWSETPICITSTVETLLPAAQTRFKVWQRLCIVFFCKDVQFSVAIKADTYDRSSRLNQNAHSQKKIVYWSHLFDPVRPAGVTLDETFKTLFSTVFFFLYLNMQILASEQTTVGSGCVGKVANLHQWRTFALSVIPVVLLPLIHPSVWPLKGIWDDQMQAEAFPSSLFEP